MGEPTLKSEVLGMMPETWRPKTKTAVFNHSIRRGYTMGNLTWSMKVSEAKERLGDAHVDEFLATIRANMEGHIHRFLWHE